MSEEQQQQQSGEEQQSEGVAYYPMRDGRLAPLIERPTRKGRTFYFFDETRAVDPKTEPLQAKEDRRPTREEVQRALEEAMREAFKAREGADTEERRLAFVEHMRKAVQQCMDDPKFMPKE